MLRNFHATSCFPGVPRFYPELRLAAKSTGAEGGGERYEQILKSPCLRGKCREADGRKERFGMVFRKKSDRPGQVPWSQPQH